MLYNVCSYRALVLDIIWDIGLLIPERDLLSLAGLKGIALQNTLVIHDRNIIWVILLAELQR